MNPWSNSEKLPKDNNLDATAVKPWCGVHPLSPPLAGFSTLSSPFEGEECRDFVGDIPECRLRGTESFDQLRPSALHFVLRLSVEGRLRLEEMVSGSTSLTTLRNSKGKTEP
jgi:hypothetical protein